MTIFAETDCPARRESDCSPPLCNWTGMTCTSLNTAGTPQLVCTRRQADLTLRDETRPNYFTTSAFFGLGHKYTWVRGFVRAYTAGSPDAFRPESGRSAHTETTIDEPYIDGLSITHGTGQPSCACPHFCPHLQENAWEHVYSHVRDAKGAHYNIRRRAVIWASWLQLLYQRYSLFKLP